MEAFWKVGRDCIALRQQMRPEWSERCGAIARVVEAPGVVLDGSIRVKNFSEIRAPETLQSPEMPRHGTPPVQILCGAKIKWGVCDYRELSACGTEITRECGPVQSDTAFVSMSHMRAMLRDLVAHKGYANAALLTAIHDNPRAASDPELWALLHHVLVANRFWLLTILGVPFVHDNESRLSDSFEALVERYDVTQTREEGWLASATDADLGQVLENDQIPTGRCSVSQAFMQVCLHSHGHRAQCAKLLRGHGGIPPRMDFILWLTERPAAHWPERFK